MKPFKDLTSLVSLLAERGLVMPSHGRVGETLHDLNYYRFSGYARQFQISPKDQKNDFRPGVSFDEICQIMEDDNNFRSILGEALRVVELSIRARYAHELGRLMGESAFYLDADRYLDVMKTKSQFITKIESDLSRSKSPMIARYTANDSLEKVPIWVAVEVMSFGSVAKMMNYLDDNVPAKIVAASYSIAWEGFASAIHALAVLRNMCAHHSQIWNRKMSIQCPTNKRDRPRGLKYDSQGPYAAIIALKVLMKSITNNNSWATKVDEFLANNISYADGIYNPFAK